MVFVAVDFNCANAHLWASIVKWVADTIDKESVPFTVKITNQHYKLVFVCVWSISDIVNLPLLNLGWGAR
jgi:hypothetical protein